MSEIPLTEGPQDIAGLQRQINELKRQINALGGSISVTDGSTTVSPATSLDFIAGASVGDGGGGIAQVSVSGGGGGSPGSPINSVQFNSAASFGGTNLSYDGSGFSSPFVSTYSAASALGAAITNAGSGGTDGATVLTVVGGTGTPPQFNATITGGVLTSIDSVAVAGDMSAIPADPVAVTSSDAGPLVGATVNFGSSGWNYAPAIVGSDAASGFGLNGAGLPRLTDQQNGTVLELGINFSPIVTWGAVLLSSNNSNGPALILSPSEGIAAGSSVVMSNFGLSDNVFYFSSARGVAGAPSPLLDGDVIQDFLFEGYHGSVYTDIADIYVNAAVGAHFGASMSFQTTDTVSGTESIRIVIDGNGNTNIENGHLNVANTAPTVSSSAGAPTLDATASDTAGLVTVGDASTTTTITFNAAFASTPHVVLSNPDGTLAGLTYTVSTTAIVATYTLNTGGTFAYAALG